jgi:hypothetical protein
MRSERSNLVMSVFPFARGIAYVVFEGPNSPVDWGICDPHGDRKKHHAIRIIAALVDRYSPGALILRDRVGIRRGRNWRHAALVEALETLAHQKGISIARLSRDQVRQSFSSLKSPTRYEIVQTIAKQVPIFETYVPPIRKIWKAEDRRMGMFDAAALALTFYRMQNADDPKSAVARG